MDFKRRKEIKFFIIIMGFIVISSFLIFALDFVSAETAGVQFRSGLDTSAGEMGYDARPAQGSFLLSGHFLSKKVGKIIEAILSFLGVAFLILMIYGGFIWMMAQGNEQEVTKAKSIIISAIIGLIVILSAYAITAIVGREIASVVVDP